MIHQKRFPKHILVRVDNTKPKQTPTTLPNSSSATTSQPTFSARKNITTNQQKSTKLFGKIVNQKTQEINKPLLAPYRFESQKPKSKLPIHDFRSQIIDTIQKHQVVVITGRTGCGKTTQLPQLIYQHALENGHSSPTIVCTQPIRMAATSLALRVKKEMEDLLSMGDVKYTTNVGHMIGGDYSVVDNSGIVYATEGCVSQMLMKNSNKKNFMEKFHENMYSHIILDEIHERNVDTDLLLYWSRELLKKNTKVKIILMSATMEYEKIVNYFGKTIPTIEIPSGCYPVEENYIEEAYNLVTYGVTNVSKESLKKNELNILIRPPSTPQITKERRRVGLSLIQKLHQIHRFDFKQSIIVFLPGLIEIEDFCEDISLSYFGGIHSPECPFEIHILHSLIAKDEQDLALLPAKQGKRKIILSTNVAESSITIPDVTFVIDFCLSKQTYWDEEIHCEVLKTQWISKNSAIQRKGRAGRVAPGTVFRMVTKEEYNHFKQCITPEILRKPLAEVLLRILIVSGASAGNSFLYFL